MIKDFQFIAKPMNEFHFKCIVSKYYEKMGPKEKQLFFSEYLKHF